VGVQIDHAGQHDPRTKIDGARHIGWTVSGGARERDAPGGVDEEEAVGLVARPAGVERRQQARAKAERRFAGNVVKAHDGRC
jgi:hypothetical protein